MKKGVLSDMTWKEVAEVIDQVKIALIPIGSTEQHGPHLPLKHDTSSISYVAEKLAEIFYPKVLVTPVIPFGVSYHHMSFPGTITVRPETLSNLIKDVCESLAKHGIEKILILNGHGGNFEAISTSINAIRRLLNIDVYFISYWDLIPKDAQKIVEDGAFAGHSADFETSIGLYIYPEMVRTDLIKDSDHVDDKLSNAEKLLVEKSRMSQLLFEKSSSGVPIGDPTLASSKKGDQILNETIKGLTSFLKTLIEVT